MPRTPAPRRAVPAARPPRLFDIAALLDSAARLHAANHRPAEATRCRTGAAALRGLAAGEMTSGAFAADFLTVPADGSVPTVTSDD